MPQPRLRARNLRPRRKLGDRSGNPGRWRTTRPAGRSTRARTCPPRHAGPRLAAGAGPRRPRGSCCCTAVPAPRVGDGVIGSPPAFGAVQSRFESESPSAVHPCRRPRSSVIPQESPVPAAAAAPTVAAVVVLAAGQGTRMRSSTPKVLHTLGGRSLLGHVLAAAEPLRAATTAVVVGAGREAVEEHLGQIAPAALPVVQAEQRGSGHAAAVALAAVPDLEGPVLLVNGDAPLLRAATVSALVEAHRSAGSLLTVLTAEVDDPTGLGRIVRDGSGAVRAIVEERDADETQ